jgi:hypothetical protein
MSLFIPNITNQQLWENYIATTTGQMKIDIQNFVKCHNAYYQSKILCQELKKDSLEDKILADHPCEETHEGYTFTTDESGRREYADGFMDYIDLDQIENKNESMDQHNNETQISIPGLKDPINSFSSGSTIDSVPFCSNH